MKYDIKIEEVKKMYENGMMMKDIAEYYGCNRSTLYQTTKKYGLNFRNNENFRRNQSKLMSGSMNPTKGKKRPPEDMMGTANASRERANVYWEYRFSKDGITFKQYAKICRSIVPKELKDQAKWKEKEVDHIFSVKDCWKNKIHPRYASSKENLRVVSSQENLHKCSRSNVTLEEFLSMIGVQRLSKAQFNWKQVE